jgi:hypothetical protein
MILIPLYRSRGGEDSEVSADESERGRPQLPGSFPTPATSNLDSVDDISHIVRMQARKIAQLESRLESIETQPLQQSRGFRDPYQIQSPALTDVVKLKQYMRSPDDPGESQKTKESDEILLFRGKRFATQFYGASGPATLLRHVSCASPSNTYSILI